MKRRTVNIPLLILAALLLWRTISIQRNAATLDELDRQIAALEKNIAAMESRPHR